jgi:hypothetical protein
MQALQRSSYWLAVGILLIYGTLALSYSVKSNYLDHGEPSVAVLAQQVWLGYSVYQTPDAGQRTVLSYGPSLFLLYAPFVQLSPNPILASKLLALLLSLCGGVCALWSFRQHSSKQIAVICAALVALSFLTFRNMSFWTRPESLILFGSGLFLVALNLPKHLAIICGAIALALIINAKIIAPIYLIALIWLFTSKHGLKNLFILAGLSLVLVLLPFALTSRFPILNYIYWLRHMGNHDFLISQLVSNLQESVQLALPSWILLFILWRQSGFQQHSIVIAHAFNLIMLVVVSIIGSKFGAGRYYLMLCLPSLAYVSILTLEQIDLIKLKNGLRGPTRLGLIGAALVWILPILLLGILVQSKDLHYYFDPEQAAIQQDLFELRDRLPNNVQMGYGESQDYDFSFARPILYQQGQPYLIDSMSYWDMRLSQIEPSPALLDQFRKQTSDYWLIPRDNKPFAIEVGFDLEGSFHPLFVGINEVFEANYQRIDHSQYFDIWQAKRLSP